MGARLARPVAPLLERLGLNSLAAMLRLAPARLPTRDQPAVAASATSTQSGAQPRRRVALLSGCVASVLAPQINAAAARVLARNGIEVVPVPGEKNTANSFLTFPVNFQ